MPPPCRNHRDPTGPATPTASAAASLVNPSPIRRQNARSTSRRGHGRPGDLNLGRTARSAICCRRTITHLQIKLLRRPVESDLGPGVAEGPSSDPAGLPGPVGPCGDLAALLPQHPTDRLDRKPLRAHLVDEAHHQRLRGSSSPAKKVAAAFKIATSSRSRRFSAFNRRISSDSSLVTPSRCPASISAWITHRRTDSFPTPTCLATACDAAVNVGYSPRCSLTRRTALAFSSGSIIFGMLLILLDSNRSGIKPGALHSADQVRRAVMLYEQGKSLAVIGKLLGVDAGTVHTRLRE